jgi:cobalt/nickel transport protein
MRRFMLVLGLMLVIAPFASSSPDGLEQVAADKGFAERARPPQSAPVPDYAFPGVGDPRLATALAGLAGVLVLGAVAVVVRRPRTA